MSQHDYEAHAAIKSVVGSPSAARVQMALWDAGFSTLKVDEDRLAAAIGESFYLSSQGMSDWPTLDECRSAAKPALREVLRELGVTSVLPKETQT